MTLLKHWNHSVILQTVKFYGLFSNFEFAKQLAQHAMRYFSWTVYNLFFRLYSCPWVSLSILYEALNGMLAYLHKSWHNQVGLTILGYHSHNDFSRTLAQGTCKFVHLVSKSIVNSIK